MKSLINCSVRSSVIGIAILAWSGGWAAGADFPSTVLSQGPAGYWRLNETNQPVAPLPAADIGSLGSAADGQYQGNPKRGEPGALAGSAATSVRFFNPDQDPALGRTKVEAPFNSALNPTGPFSVEFWVKPSMVVTDAFCMAASLDSDPTIGVGANANPRAGWLFYQNGSPTNAVNQWQFRLGNAHGYLDGDAIRGGPVTPGAWHHIVGTYDGANASLYVNGVRVATRAISGYLANQARPFRIGTTCFDGSLGPIGSYAGNRGFDGWLQEVAFYGTALSATDIAAHYNAGQTNGANYASLVLADQPLGYWRLGEPGNPPALNLGSLGPDANGEFVYPAQPGQAGPQPPDFPGLEATNLACGIPGTNGYVDLPALHLNTNSVTMTAWILANAIQTNNAGIVFCRGGTTVAGLKFDISDPNGLSYNWNDDSAAYNFKSSLAVPVSQWCFVALIVQPDQATLCLQDGSQFSTAVNYAVHPDQAFDGDTLIGQDISDPTLTFNGIIDEVAIFNRALSVGEVYSQYAAAVGGLKPTLFTDPAAPTQTVYVGDTLTLSVDAGGTPPLSYQWRKDGTPIPGATSSIFVQANVGAGDSGNYDVVISNAQGSVTSQQANVSVQPLSQPLISQDPQGRTLYPGGLLNLNVQASGGGLSYQWQKNGSDVPGATNATYRVDSVSTNDSGSYQVTVSNQLGTAPSAPAVVTIVGPSPGSYEDVIVRDGPESWWRLDDAESSTTLTDAMGRHDGVYKGGVTLGAPGVLAGDPNTAAVFDGTSGYAEVPFSKDLNTASFTVESWVNANAIAYTLCPVASFTQPPGRGYLIEESASDAFGGCGLWDYFFGDGVDQRVFYLPGISDAIYNQWTHLAITYDGNVFSAYVNGSLDAVTGPDIVPNNVAPFRIGLDQPASGWNDYWDGAIDEVAFYQKALSSDQVAAHYAAALYGTQTKPLFTQQLQPSTTAAAGTDFFFAPVVEGTLPIQLQWSKNGAPLPGETNSVLVLTNLSFGDTGTYQLSATNSAGSSTSLPATLAVVPSPNFANVTNGLVLHLKFDGDYSDSSGRAHDGQPVGSPTFVPGAIGNQALHYSTAVDTTNPNRPVVTANYVTLGMPADLQFSSNVNFSVSYWVRFTGTPGDLPFLCNAVNSFSNPGYTFAPSYQLGGWSWSLGDFATASFIGIYGADNSINDGSWHHLAHTFDRSSSGITYLDGNEVDSRSVVPIGDLDTQDPATIGQDPSGAYPEAGEADIDDVGVWRRVLTPFEVYAIYAAGESGTSFDTAGPVSLVATSAAGMAQLVWQAGTLFEADELSGPWSPVAGAAAPYYQVTPGAAHKFYRVRL
jgi:Concanavalin A-like lectin/glucanases superfamily/Immunoglobulin domain/Immunoglobulin I-set domain